MLLFFYLVSILTATSFPQPINNKSVEEAHNYIRRNVEPPAGGMKYMSHSQNFVKIAENLAYDICNKRPDTSKYFTTTVNIKQLDIENWKEEIMNEKKHYDYSEDRCETGFCRNFRVIILEYLKYVGCIYKTCESLHIVFCVYGAIEYLKQGQPYIDGSWCSLCDHQEKCSNQLCKNVSLCGTDCKCTLQCQNGGVFMKDQCLCLCPDGWSGTDCSLLCKNINKKCSFDKKQCPKYRKYCAKTCGSCTPFTNKSSRGHCGGQFCLDGKIFYPDSCECVPRNCLYDNASKSCYPWTTLIPTSENTLTGITEILKTTALETELTDVISNSYCIKFQIILFIYCVVILEYTIFIRKL